jgi:putative FmdB family regulatory protein
MPIYEYACPKCKSEFELKLPFSESAKAVNCPKCQAPSRKLFSSFGCKTGGNLQASEKAYRKSTRR